MFKKKNKMLLGGAILAAMGGMSSAQAANAAWCGSVATIIGDMAVTVTDVKACATTLIGTNPVDYDRLAALATKISIEETPAGTNTDLNLRAAEDMAGLNGAITASTATALYLTILSSGSTTNKNDAAISAAKTMSDNSDVMFPALGLNPNSDTNRPITFSGQGATAYIDLLVCTALTVKPDVFAGLPVNTSLQTAINNCNVSGSPVGTAAFPNVSRSNLGQVLIYPYYTTRGGKKSLINVFNTSNRTIAAKVRFRESHNSRDVLDFTVILSPHDKWSGTVQDHGDGPYFTTTDNTCTVPALTASGEKLNTDAFTGAVADGDTFGAERLKEGYVEIIAMGVAINEASSIAINAKHVKTGSVTKPANCGAIAANNGPFSPLVGFNTDKSGLPLAKLQFEALKGGENPLRGALTIINPGDNDAKGVGFGVSALAIADFNMTGNKIVNGQWKWVGGTDLITAQTPKFFHEPTLASAKGLWSVNGLPDVERALLAKTIINEWANNTANGANSDWVIQFPTKSFHVDCGLYTPPSGNVFPGNTYGRWNGGLQASRNTARGNGCNDLNFGSAVKFSSWSPNSLSGVDFRVSPFENYFNGDAGSAVTLNTVKIFDNEENMIDNSASGPGVSFSPATPNQVDVLSLRWESNIIAFSDINAPVSVLSSVAPTLHTMGVVSTDLTGQNGYAEISFKNELPVIGFVAKDRNQNDPGVNFGQIMRHSYR